MSIPFVKYSGTGNDFICIDDRNLNFPHGNISVIQTMCDRHFGIGSDGLMLIRHHSDCDFEMIFFNPDGSKSLCGNGSRCSVHFARQLGLAKTEGKFTTTDGIHHYQFIEDKIVEISMSNVAEVSQIKEMDFVNTGSPHLIVPMRGLEEFDILTEGRKWRYDECFEELGGTNVNFVKVLNSDSLEMRTYERGVENETLSCGTGVTAAALSHKKNKSGTHRVDVHTKGGKLSVSFENNERGFSNIRLLGPVLRIFEGVYDVGK
jgi:diaminopimelate epimerase